MKIKTLTLHGFKSFADPTKLEFHEGITAIVGPNGCGKSNISDAIRWVLGEQRPTVIRGSRMDEAIFSGTEQRRPIHRAEVSFLLSNEDGKLPVPYTEVEIGRTVYRGGESAYTLNGAPCRLKDILDLCRDTGLGASAYSIIEARMIDAILSDRAEERRALFEEAAEIGRYKDRRRTALRRLEAATADLQRLDDLIDEVGSKVRSLARQRGRADRHARLRERFLQLEIAVAGERLSDLDRRIADATQQLDRLRTDAPGEETQLHKQEAEIETLRLRMVEEGSRRSGLADRLAAVRDRLNRLEAEGLVETERASSNVRRIETIREELAELAGRSASVASELERFGGEDVSARSRLEEARGRETELLEPVQLLEAARDAESSAVEETLGRHNEVVRRISALESECNAAEERHEERGREMERLRQLLRSLEARREETHARREVEAAEVEAAERSRAALEERLDAARAEAAKRRDAWRGVRDRAAEAEGGLSADRARLSNLESVVASGGGRPACVTRLLEADRLPRGVIGPLMDFLEAPADLAPAIEAHLGGYLNAVLVEDWKSVEAVRRWMERHDEEQGLVLLPVAPGPRTRPGAGGRPGSLWEQLKVTGPAESWLRALLGDVERPEAFGPGDGAWVLPDGSGQDSLGAVRLGKPLAGRGTLELRAETTALQEKIDGSQKDLEKLRSELAEIETDLAKREAELESIGVELHEADRALREAEGRHQAASGLLESLDQEGKAVTVRIDELALSIQGFEGGGGERDRELAALREEDAAAEAAVAEGRKRARRAAAELDEGRATLHELQLELARLGSEAKAAAERTAGMEGRRDELQGQRSRLEKEVEEREQLTASLARNAEQREEGMASLLEERVEIEEVLTATDAELAGMREAVETEEASVRERRRAEREHSERRHALELDLAERRAHRSNIRERLEAEWGEEFEELAARVEPLEEGSLEDWAEELEELRTRIRKLGPVNPLAAQEYEEEKERLTFLEEQQADIAKATEDLQTSIRRINRAAAEAFLETFQEIRENFTRTFSTLFEGGECDLWLDPEDPLDSPIEISASPRGKRTQRIHLLSGGERALTALSLLFAIYLAKPSPFCVMDEVDAPLDEANIGRFIRMLEEFKSDTQFVVITHNPRTIEAADWIYGVTMQEPGVSSIVGVQFRDLPSGQVA